MAAWPHDAVIKRLAVSSPISPTQTKIRALAYTICGHPISIFLRRATNEQYFYPVIYSCYLHPAQKAFLVILSLEYVHCDPVSHIQSECLSFDFVSILFAE